MENSRDTLLRRLQICDFNLVEAALYLDTHPNDQEALAYYRKYLEMQKETQAEYTSKYGPIVQQEAAKGDEWCWVKDPWPWERSEE